MPFFKHAEQVEEYSIDDDDDDDDSELYIENFSMVRPIEVIETLSCICGNKNGGIWGDRIGDSTYCIELFITII
jgi:hypothetical protein